jgi:hypothetical protein
MSSTRRRLERLEARLPARPEAEGGLMTPAARRFFDAWESGDEERADAALVEWAEETPFTPAGLIEALLNLSASVEALEEIDNEQNE